ncbi:hydrogen gas-evolving membrane-bound hydrogenase subunit E [Crenalkalicoccus roseus]|uniref:hydrogen gas-evolving membrane-bound hydrogenase subunit E n=1 Tax=Crenalkalicoccus roseus TaxID=1485588 RepID=UPI001081AF1F|nr:hydrogen gas-evolving membrane-bound hydrogenase subunit E [Crenalkalicoccus roseus]
MLFPTLLVFAALLAVPVIALAVRRWPALAPASALLPAALFVLALLTPPEGPATAPWIPSLNVAFAWHADGLARLFVLLITGIGAGIFLYASAYLHGHPQLHRFMAVLCLFMASMLGAVLADDLLLLFIFWEMTSLASFMLIGFEAERASARKSAQQGLLVTVGGGLALLAGILLLGSAAGTFRISAILAQGEAVAQHALGPWIMVLVAIGAFAKSAQWPQHMWLPNAMAAPTPVSAYLHSATMVKLGVYLLARLNPAFQLEPLWQAMLIGIGAMTMVTGAVLALRETDLKLVLAWSTVVALGTLVALIGVEDPRAATAVIVVLLVHALYKACLFMVAGILDHETGTRDATRLRGLQRLMPMTGIAAALGALSMAGLPPFVGFVAKEMLYEVKLDVPGLLPLVAMLVNAAMVVVAGVVAARPFLGPLAPTPRKPHDPPLSMLAAPLALAGLGILFGIAPWLIAEGLVEPAAAAILGRPTEAKLVLWHGFTIVLFLSVATLGLGLALYLAWSRVQPALASIRVLDEVGPNALYTRWLGAVQAVSAWQTALIQSGSMRRYVAISFAIIFGGAAAALLAGGGLAWPGLAPAPGAHQAALVALVAIGAVAACVARALVAQVMAVGIVGFGIGILFLSLGAADLAFTQFTVEVIAIVLLVAVLARLPFRAPDARTPRARRWDAALAVGVGVIGAAVMLAVLAEPFDARIPEWMGAAAVPEAKGRNIVNVILVDFRALDTLGEIAVIAIAAMAAAVLFRRVKGGRA